MPIHNLNSQQELAAVQDLAVLAAGRLRLKGWDGRRTEAHDGNGELFESYLKSSKIMKTRPESEPNTSYGFRDFVI